MATSYLFKLDPVDRRNRAFLEKAYRKVGGETFSFRLILQHILAKEVVAMKRDHPELFPSSK